jgi:hypothetical protein
MGNPDPFGKQEAGGGNSTKEREDGRIRIKIAFL